MRSDSRGGYAGNRARTVCVLIAHFLLVVFLFAGEGRALAAPLLWDGSNMEGLYQRVVIQPGAKLHDAPGGAENRALTTFSVYYVFARKQVDGASWLNIGPGMRADPIGWLPADKSVDFRQNIVLTFQTQSSDSPVLFFDRPESIGTFVAQRDTLDIEALTTRARNGEVDESLGIIALQPEEVPDFRQQFYMLPILDTVDVDMDGINYSRGQEGSRLLQVASVTEASDSAPSETPEQALAKNFRTGIVFVIDTTLSMGPYIRRTQSLARRLFEKIEQSELGERVSFGVIGYRDNIDARPKLDYLTKEYHPLETDFRRDDFLAALDSITATTVSSVGFEEDGLAAVDRAMKLDAWEDFGARFIVFITDAPVRTAGDSLSAPKVNPEDLATEARKNESLFGIFSFFLETPPQPDLHTVALRQLGALSQHTPDEPPLLFPIPGGDVDVFGDKVEQAVGAMIDLTRSVIDNDPENAGPASDDDETMEGVHDLGRAMKLAWLGRHLETPAPQLVKAWTPGFGLDNIRTNRPPFSIRVLMTRSQLNRLYQSLGLIEESMRALTGEQSSRGFFDTLRNVLASAQNNPDLIGSLAGDSSEIATIDDSADSVADLVDGYISHLPYKSDLLSLSAENLEQLGPAAIAQHINVIHSKREIYRKYAQNESLWVTLNEEAGRDEMVYAVPLAQLP